MRMWPCPADIDGDVLAAGIANSGALQEATGLTPDLCSVEGASGSNRFWLTSRAAYIAARIIGGDSGRKGILSKHSHSSKELHFLRHWVATVNRGRGIPHMPLHLRV